MTACRVHLIGIGRGLTTSPTGSPGAGTCPWLPQNVACGCRESNVARATVGGALPPWTLSVVQRVPRATMVHVSTSRLAVPDGQLSRVRFWLRLCTPCGCLVNFRLVGSIYMLRGAPRGMIALSQTTENRKVDARKPLIFRNPVFGFYLQNPTLRQSRGRGEALISMAGSNERLRESLAPDHLSLPCILFWSCLHICCKNT